MADVSRSIRAILDKYTGVVQMYPEVDVITKRLAAYLHDEPCQALQDAQTACQKHLHKLMINALEKHDGDLEQNPEIRAVIRSIFQLSALRDISSLPDEFALNA